MMKKTKKLSLLIAVVMLFSFVLSLGVFAHDDIKPIDDNDKIFAYIPWEYEFSGFLNNLTYCDEDGNTITYCVGENKFAPKGITALKDWQIQTVFEHFYLYDGDLERQNECTVEYKESRKEKINGYSAYYLSGRYNYGEKLNEFLSYHFNAFVFATKEDIFVVSYEDINGDTENYEDLMTAVSVIVFNGTPFDGEMPEKNGNHDFSNSPAFQDVVTILQESLMGEVFEENGFLPMIAGTLIAITIAPTVVLIAIAAVLMVKYSKNKKKLKRYELTYGNIIANNPLPPVYNGYGYNPPAENPQYQQNPANQNVQQTPSYVTNAVNNLEGQQPTQPAQPNLSPEMQDNKINNENKI